MIVPYLLFGRWETQLWVILKSWSESQTGVSDKHKVKPLAEYRNHFSLSRTLAFIIIKAPRLVMTRPVITVPLSHATIYTVVDCPTVLVMNHLSQTVSEINHLRPIMDGSRMGHPTDWNWENQLITLQNLV